MRSNIMIKSIPNGIKVQLNGECDFQSLCDEIKVKFSQSKGFFKGGKIAVSFEGRVLSEEEEKTLISIIEDEGELNVLYMITPEENGEIERSITKSLNKTLMDQDVTGFGTVYRGTVLKGEHLQFECGVVVMGDVEPGALVRARGNVIILGGLYGSVNIDFNEGERPGFVFASDMSPERIRIGEARNYSEKSKWLIRPKYQAKIAYLADKKIVIAAVDKSALKTLADLK